MRLTLEIGFFAGEAADTEIFVGAEPGNVLGYKPFKEFPPGQGQVTRRAPIPVRLHAGRLPPKTSHI